LKVLGDFIRYQAEYTVSNKEAESIMKQAEEKYEKSIKIVRDKLANTSALKLDLVNNYAVFLYEVKR